MDEFPRNQLVRDLGFTKTPEALDEAIRPARRTAAAVKLPVVEFDSPTELGALSVREIAAREAHSADRLRPDSLGRCGSRIFLAICLKSAESIC